VIWDMAWSFACSLCLFLSYFMHPF